MLGGIVSKRRILFLIAALLLMTAVFFWQLPAILKAMPSRYVARLPQPLQDLGVRGDGVAILPTVAAPMEAAALLQTAPLPTTTPSAPPPTPTPPALDVATAVPNTPTPTSTATPTPIPIPAAVRLDGFRHQFQTWNNCGPATIAMSLSYYGLTLDQSETAVFLKPDPEDRNVSPYQMAAYVNENTLYAAIDRTNGTLETVKRLVAAGFPTVIELGIEPPGEYRWLGWYGHYLLIVAYDDALEQFWVYDSWFGTSDVPMENATVDGRILHYADADLQWRQFNRNYITLYRPEEAAQVAAIIGEDMDDAVMWSKSLTRTQAELTREPEDAFLWFNLGTIYNALGEYDKAATAFDQARAIGLPWRMLWYQFGPYEAYYQAGRYEDIITLADATLKDRPYFEEAYYYKGQALAALGDTDAARENFVKAAAFNPNFLPPTSALNELSD
jgi:tetratricopeptide (TPR) repeat protein